MTTLYEIDDMQKEIERLKAEIESLKAENERLRQALRNYICTKGSKNVRKALGIE